MWMETGQKLHVDKAQDFRKIEIKRLSERQDYFLIGKYSFW